MRLNNQLCSQLRFSEADSAGSCAGGVVRTIDAFFDSRYIFHFSVFELREADHEVSAATFPLIFKVVSQCSVLNGLRLVFIAA